MRKYAWSIFFLFCLTNIAYPQNIRLQTRKIRNPRVLYQPAERIRRYPFPVVNFERAGLAREGDQQEIMEKIVYPVINRSRMPIAAIIVTFYDDNPDITVLVLWHGNEFRGQVIERNAQGRFDANAYKVFLEEIQS